MGNIFNIFHAFLIIPVLLFGVDFLYDVLIDMGLGIVAIFVYVVLNVFLLSGFFGLLVEIVSEERNEMTRKGFLSNAKKYGKTLFFYYFVALACFVLLKKFGIITEGTIHSFISYFDIVIFYFLARTIIKDKYATKISGTSKKVHIDHQSFATILFLFVFNIFLLTVNSYVYVETFSLTMLVAFCIRCLQTFTFIYLSKTILRNSYGQIFEPENRELHLIVVPNSGIVNGILYPIFVHNHPGMFVVLKALTPKSYKIKKFNRVMWRKSFYKKGVLVAISCFTSNCYEAFRIAKNYKKAGATVIMGGPHVTYLPAEALEFCDSVVVGEAEGVWEDVVNDYEAGTLKKLYSGGVKEDYFQKVHQELLNSPADVIKDFLETSRGCKFKCDFCTIPALNGGRTRVKPVSEVVELVNLVKKKYPRVWFIDNNIYSNPGYSKELFTALEGLNVNWGAQCTIDVAKNDEVLRMMKKSGCDELIFGLEITGASLQKEKRGKYAMADQYIDYMKKIKRMGIPAKGQFIFGFENETWRDIWHLWKYCLKLQGHYTGISYLTPLPGAQVYSDMLKANCITNLNWRQYDMQHAVFRHKTMNNTFVKYFIPVFRIVFVMTTSFFGKFFMFLLISATLFALFAF